MHCCTAGCRTSVSGSTRCCPGPSSAGRVGRGVVAVRLLLAGGRGGGPPARPRLYTVLPGAVVGGALWVGAAASLSYTLRSAGKLALLYGSFAGVVATLVFLYVSATTLIFGAEINGVLRGPPSPG